jgi:hypothetical protein
MGAVRTRWVAVTCLAAGTITGFLIGLALMVTIVSSRMEDHYRMNAYLESVISEKDARLEQLEKVINNGSYVLKGIEIVFTCEEENVDMLPLDIEIKKKLNTLLGREVKTLDAEMIAEVADKRIMRVEGREYQLFVKKLILGETLRLWIEVEALE